MTKQKNNSNQKIIQRALIGAVALGVTFAILRVLIAFVGAINIPTAMSNMTGSTHSSFNLLSFFAPFVFTVSPYLLAIGALAAFLYVYLFRDEESRNIFIGWGILMTLYLITTFFFVWI